MMMMMPILATKRFTTPPFSLFFFPKHLFVITSYNRKENNQITCSLDVVCVLTNFSLSFGFHPSLAMGQTNGWSNRTTTKVQQSANIVCQLVSVKIEHISCHRESEVLSANEQEHACVRACVHTCHNVHGKSKSFGSHTKYGAFARNGPGDVDGVVLSLYWPVIFFVFSYIFIFIYTRRDLILRPFILFLFDFVGLTACMYVHKTFHLTGVQ